MVCQKASGTTIPGLRCTRPTDRRRGAGENYISRIERITLSRNLCLDELKLKNYDNLIYIPIDLDVNLFELTDIESFHKILNS